MKKKSTILLLVACWLAPFFPLAAQPKRPAPELLCLDNKVVKVGIDRSMGASITWLSWDKHPQNIINIHDPGRLLQQSYYAGKSLDRQAEGQSKAWSPWSWNPIQGGGVNSWARVTRFEMLEGRKLVAETVPKLWDMPNEEAEALMVQSVEFEAGMSDVLLINNRLICKRKPGDRWGPPVPRHQELPACYFTSSFRNIHCYLGKGQWRKVEQPAGPPWGKAEPELKAMACFNDQGQGVALYSPTADKHWNFGPHGKYNANAKDVDGPCVHMAPIGLVKLGPTSTLEFRYWLMVGERAAISARLDALLAKYPKEQLKLTDAPLK
jgi:hypothetical protein